MRQRKRSCAKTYSEKQDNQVKIAGWTDVKVSIISNLSDHSKFFFLANRSNDTLNVNTDIDYFPCGFNVQRRQLFFSFSKCRNFPSRHTLSLHLTECQIHDQQEPNHLAVSYLKKHYFLLYVLSLALPPQPRGIKDTVPCGVIPRRNFTVLWCL